MEKGNAVDSKYKKACGFYIGFFENTNGMDKYKINMKTIIHNSGGYPYQRKSFNKNNSNIPFLNKEYQRNVIINIKYNVNDNYIDCMSYRYWTDERNNN